MSDMSHLDHLFTFLTVQLPNHFLGAMEVVGDDDWIDIPMGNVEVIV